MSDLAAKYTPTTEDVRTYYGLGCYEFQPDSCEHPNERHPEFDRWLNTTLAEAEKRGAARALREAADRMSQVPDYTPSDYDQGRVDQRHMNAEELLKTADRVEAGE